MSGGSIAIIGCGAAGIISAYNFALKNLNDFDIFEMSDSIGGVWNQIDDSVNTKCKPMYASLRTNLPMEVMAFRPECQFNKQDNASSYCSQLNVLQYLKDFVDNSNVVSKIRFNTRVENITKDNKSNKWIVSSTANMQTDHPTLHVDFYDFVIVCNGHFNVPNIPSIRDMDRFKGRIHHSVSYNSDIPYVNQNVLIIGVKSSGMDISWNISKVAKHVYISNRQLTHSAPHVDNPNVTFTPIIDCVNSQGQVVFVDGTCIDVDIIIYCTGYLYEYPFLKEYMRASELKLVQHRSVQPLYKHIFNVNDPTLCFVGLLYTVIPFPMCNAQACYIASIISGTSQLPSFEDRLSDYLKDKTDREADIHRYHYMGGKQQFEYMQIVLSEAKVLDESMSVYLKILEEIYNDNASSLPKCAGSQPVYRDRSYTIHWEEKTWSVKPIVN